MKTLKITFLLLAVVLLTISGQSSDRAVHSDEETYKEYSTQDLMALKKKRKSLETNG